MHYTDNLFNALRDNGYTYFIIPKKSRSKVYFTKSKQNDTLFGDQFDDNVEFNEFTLKEKIDKELFKIFPRNTFIKL